MDAVLKCPICSERFNESSNKPLLLPGCGHTFCSVCLMKLQSQCSLCRKNIGQSKNSLPVNYSVLSMVNIDNEMKESARKQLENDKQNSKKEDSKVDGAASLDSVSKKETVDPITEETYKELCNMSLDSNDPEPDLINKKSLQEEIDFQMAVHLTFCKNKAHNHDGDTPQHLIQEWKHPSKEEFEVAVSVSKCQPDLLSEALCKKWFYNFLEGINFYTFIVKDN